eukprot:91717-Chlamydomonas_euryale.AAC.1
MPTALPLSGHLRDRPVDVHIAGAAVVLRLLDHAHPRLLHLGQQAELSHLRLQRAHPGAGKKERETESRSVVAPGESGIRETMGGNQVEVERDGDRERWKEREGATLLRNCSSTSASFSFTSSVPGNVHNLLRK